MQISNDYELLKFIPFNEANSWNVVLLLNEVDIFNDSFEIVSFEVFASKPTIKKIQISNDKTYKILGVRSYGKGAFVNRIIKGDSLKMRTYQQAKTNHLFWCKVDTKNGAFGIIDESLSDGIASSNMTFLELDLKKINPSYLQIAFSSPKYNAYMDTFITGTTNRKYIRPDEILSTIKIPLPSFEVQKALVEAYQNKLNQADKLEQEATNLENEIEEYLLTELGIELNKQEKRKIAKLYFIEFKKIARWDASEYDLFDSIFEIQKIEKYITNISTGTTPPTSKKEYFNGNINFFTPADLGKEMYLTNSSRTITQKAIEDNKARVFKRGTILFVGIGSTVGKVGIVDNDLATSNQQITGFEINKKYLIPEYVYCFFNQFKQITTSEKSVSTIPIVNQEKILNIPIPVPPLETQIKISDSIQQMKNSQKNKFQKAQQLKSQALLDFEKAIFKPAK